MRAASVAWDSCAAASLLSLRLDFACAIFNLILVKPDLKFIMKNLRREFLEQDSPRGDEAPVAVLAAIAGDCEPASNPRVGYPSPNLPASGAEQSMVLMIDLLLVPSGEIVGSSEEPIAQEVHGWHHAPMRLPIQQPSAPCAPRGPRPGARSTSGARTRDRWICRH